MLNDDLKRSGYCLVPPGNDPVFMAQIDTLARLFEEQRDSAQSKHFYNKDGVARHLILLSDRHDAVIRSFLQHAAIRERVAAVSRSPLYVTIARISYKTPGKEVPWFPHQDNGYKAMSGNTITDGFACGVFLDDVDEGMGPIQVYPGSHLNGVLPHERVFENERLDYQVQVKTLPPAPPVSLVGPRGTLVFFHQNTIHVSGNNRTDRWRPILLFECEPYRRGLTRDGNVPVVFNHELSSIDRYVTHVAGVRKKAMGVVRGIKPLHQLYRRVVLKRQEKQPNAR